VKAFQSVRSQRAVSPFRVGVLCSETGAGSFPALNETMKGCSVMRSRITSALVALMAVLALGAVAASGASAHEYFIEGKSMKELGLTEETFSLNKASSMSFGAEGIEVTCYSTALSGVIKAGGTGTAKFTASECEVTAPANCSIVRPVVFETNSSLVEIEAKLIDEFTIVGSEGAALDFGGSACSGKVWPLTGYVGSHVVSEAESATMKLAFKSFEYSEFRLGGNAAYVKSGLSVQLSGANAGKKWSAKK